MVADRFHDMLKASPFRRFLVKTTDGDTFTVKHPDYALVSPRGTDVVIYDEDDHFRHVAMEHIVTLEPVRNGVKKVGKR
jgi:hypothetical protein